MDPKHLPTLHALAAQHKLDVRGGRVRRTSSRFCLGVEHGDYNGTSLFGVGTDRGGRRGSCSPALFACGIDGACRARVQRIVRAHLSRRRADRAQPLGRQTV